MLEFTPENTEVSRKRAGAYFVTEQDVSVVKLSRKKLPGLTHSYLRQPTTQHLYAMSREKIASVGGESVSVKEVIGPDGKKNAVLDFLAEPTKDHIRDLIAHFRSEKNPSVSSMKKLFKKVRITKSDPETLQKILNAWQPGGNLAEFMRLLIRKREKCSHASEVEEILDHIVNTLSPLAVQAQLIRHSPASYSGLNKYSHAATL